MPPKLSRVIVWAAAILAIPAALTFVASIVVRDPSLALPAVGALIACGIIANIAIHTGK